MLQAVLPFLYEQCLQQKWCSFLSLILNVMFTGSSVLDTHWYARGRWEKNWLKVSALFKQGKSKIESSFPFACLSATALGEWETRRVCVTAEACKRSWTFCPECRWQVTATHTCMHPTYVALHEVMWHGAWLLVVWSTRKVLRRQQFHVAPAM